MDSRARECDAMGGVSFDWDGSDEWDCAGVGERVAEDSQCRGEARTASVIDKCNATKKIST